MGHPFLLGCLGAGPSSSAGLNLQGGSTNFAWIVRRRGLKPLFHFGGDGGCFSGGGSRIWAEFLALMPGNFSFFARTRLSIFYCQASLKVVES